MQIKFLSALVIVALCSANLSAASLAIVPNLFDGKFAMLEQLMPDGNSIMGVAGNEIFRWTPSGGRESLGILGPETNVFPSAMSADGKTIVGRRIGWQSEELVRWTASGGLEVLPTTGSHPYNPYPWRISDDGSVINGTSFNVFTQPRQELYWMGLLPNRDDVYVQEGQEANFRWDTAGGFNILPGWQPPPIAGQLTFTDASADGAIVAGMVNSVPTIWSEAKGFQQPSGLPTYPVAIVNKISADGNTVIGTYRPNFAGIRVFRWKVGGAFESLTDGTDNYASAHLVSADGRTIVGFVQEGSSDVSHDVIWREGQGRQRIVDYFADHGVVIPFPGYHSISEMSRDGLVFLGSTSNPTGIVNGQPTFESTRWIVDMRAVPEPGSALLAAMCWVGVTIGTRFRGRRLRRSGPQRQLMKYRRSFT